MKIQRAHFTTAFRDLPAGRVFVEPEGDDIFFRVEEGVFAPVTTCSGLPDGDYDTINAANIRTGVLCCFDPDTRVCDLPNSVVVLDPSERE
jgi:hypothetical protein